MVKSQPRITKKQVYNLFEVAGTQESVSTVIQSGIHLIPWAERVSYNEEAFPNPACDPLQQGLTPAP